MSGISIFLIS